ncbi:endo alpha-1,4 polygalactosaminidase [Dactylosporangium sp. NPDC050688]|uniref:endo alpha-1,4 polygalactosaminidase n=1 Tax=Dactylosporangium sp. NPDC050688 TaxID=3157217 RepID=UPI0033F6AFCA
MNAPGRCRRRTALATALLLTASALTGCPRDTSRSAAPATGGWVYQLQGYDGDGLAAIARAPQRIAVIDLARDARSDLFRAGEISTVRDSGKRVLAYFEIGSIEQYRPEYDPLRAEAGDLVLNRWGDWPEEHFVRYWDERWWDRVVRVRVDRALEAGFDGVYLDTPLAYEELDLRLVPGWTRDRLARAMVDLIARVSRYARQRRPGFWIVPQNSPELRHYPGYVDAIDGIGVEELFFLATDRPCTEDYCAENLADVRALRDAGKVVLAVDYARKAGNVRAACRRYRTERFIGTVTTRELDRIAAPCG